MIRVAIADDHAVVREGLKRIIDNEARLELVGEAADGHEALKMLQAGNLDVLILDMSMPGRSGIELISLIKRESPRLPILVLSMHSEELFAVRAIRAGALGYLSKGCESEELVRAIGQTKVEGDTAFLAKLDPKFVARDLIDDRFVRKSIGLAGGPGVFGLPANLLRTETIAV